MQPLTFSTNKHFIPVANKPLIHYPIEAVAEAGIKEILITYNPGWLDYVKKQLGTGKKWGVKFTYVLQEEPKGLADIVRSCKKELEKDSFLFHLGDNIFTEGIKDLIKYFKNKKPNGLITMIHHPENWRLGVPYFATDGTVKKIVEKPKNPPHDYAMPGVYLADHNFFKAFEGPHAVKPSARGEWEIPDPFTWLIKNKYKVMVKEYEGKWLDPGKFDDWIESNRYLLDSKLETDLKTKTNKSVKVEGRVKIGRKCKIKNSEIRGPVSIGDNVEIINSYIGPYTSIYDECKLEDSHIENSVLMKGVQITNIDKPIDESLIGADAIITHENGPIPRNKFFVGEKSVIKL